ncbi:MAG: extracellular solute-binding protein [Christensenella sp.]
MNKKIVSILLTCALALSAFTGCGSKAPSSSIAANTPSAAPESSAAPKEVSYWIDLQQSGSSTATTMNDLACWPIIQKNTNINIKWEHPASGQGAEQFNLIMASNKLPDIMYYAWATSYPGGPEAAITEGKIIPLNDYIEKFAPNLNAYLKAHPDVAKDITTDEGHIYCFPAVYTSTSQDSKVWQNAIERQPFQEPFIGLIIRKDWLDELKLPVPKTMDDWYNVLKAFKEKKNAKYPMSYMGMMSEMAQSFAAGFDVTLPMTGMGSGSAFAVRKDGSVQYGPAESNYKEYLTFMNKLYSEGLLDPDYLVQDRPTLQSKILAGDVGAWIEMMPAGLGTLRSQMLKADATSKFYPIGVANPVVKDGDTLRYYQANYAYTSSGAAITSSCKDIETAMRLLDYCWGEEGNMLINWGVEGESYQMVDGWPQFTDKILHDEKGQTPSQAHSCYRQLNGPFPMDHWQRLVSKRDYSLKEGEVDENLASLNLWAKNGVQPAGLPSVTVLSEESAEFGSKLNEVSTYVGEMSSKFITGQEPLNKFDEYIKTINQFGIERVLEIQTSALDRYNKRSK